MTNPETQWREAYSEWADELPDSDVGDATTWEAFEAGFERGFRTGFLAASPKRPEAEEVAKAALNAAVASCELRPIPPVTIERALASRRDVLSATVDWQAVAVDVIALIFGEPKTEEGE